MKIAFTGTSGAGKTTLVKYLTEYLKEIHPDKPYRHLSGSAGDLLTLEDKELLRKKYNFAGDGHEDVIKFSARNPDYGYENQVLLQKRRNQLIFNNDFFVTDRSPVDNITYMVNQVGFHSQITDKMVEDFAKNSLKGFLELTHLIYIKPVQPDGVENNGSRIANQWYQRTIDAQFEYWLSNFFLRPITFLIKTPKVLVLDYWDLGERKADLRDFVS